MGCGQAESDGDEAQDRLPDPRSSAFGLCCRVLVLVLLRGQPFDRSVACYGALLLGNGRKTKKNWNTNLEATKGQEKVSSRCQTTPLGQEDDCGGRSNPKRTLRRNETILGFFKAASILERESVCVGGGVDAKNPRLNQTSVESQSFKSTAPLIYRLGGLFRVTSCLYLLA